MWGRSFMVVMDSFFVILCLIIYKIKKCVMWIFGLVVVIFIVCWLLIFVLSFVWIVFGIESVYRGYVFYEIFMFGIFINEVIIFVIYCVFDKSLRVRIVVWVICMNLIELLGLSVYID